MRWRLGRPAAVVVAVDRRLPNPLPPVRMVADSNRDGSFLASRLTGCTMLGILLFLTHMFERTMHDSALRTGFGFLPLSLGIVTRAT